MRADARENRERILEAARAVFAAEGLNVAMREIARRAEVGPATLYRHFPTKEALALEAFADQMNACHTVVERALAVQAFQASAHTGALPPVPRLAPLP